MGCAAPWKCPHDSGLSFTDFGRSWHGGGWRRGGKGEKLPAGCCFVWLCRSQTHLGLAASTVPGPTKDFASLPPSPPIAETTIQWHSFPGGRSSQLLLTREETETLAFISTSAHYCSCLLQDFRHSMVPVTLPFSPRSVHLFPKFLGSQKALEMQVLLQHKAMDGERRTAPGQGKMGGHACWPTLPSFPCGGVPRAFLNEGQVCSGRAIPRRQPEGKDHRKDQTLTSSSLRSGLRESLGRITGPDSPQTPGW